MHIEMKIRLLRISMRVIVVLALRVVLVLVLRVLVPLVLVPLVVLARLLLDAGWFVVLARLLDAGWLFCDMVLPNYSPLCI